MSIKNKKTDLKNVIKKTAASASVLALLAGGATEALGGAPKTVTITGTPSTIGTDAQNNTDAQFADGDDIDANTPNAVTTTTTSVNANSFQISKAGTKFIFNHQSSGGSVVDNGGNTTEFEINQDFTFTGDGGGTLGLARNTYDGLAAVVIDDGKKAIIKMINGNAVTFTSTFDGKVDNKVELAVAGDGAVTFKEAIGNTNSLALLSVADKAEVTLDNKITKAQTVSIGKGAKVTADTANNDQVIVTGTGNGQGLKLDDGAEFVAQLGAATKDVVIDGNVIAVSDGMGRLMIEDKVGVNKDRSFVVNGSVGTASERIGSIELHDNHGFVIVKNGGSLNVKDGIVDLANGAGNGNIGVVSNNFTINSDIGYKADGTEQKVKLLLLKASAADSKFILADDRRIAGTDIKISNDNNADLELKSGTLIKGDVELDATAGVKVGSLTFNGTSEDRAAVVKGTINSGGTNSGRIDVKGFGSIEADGAALDIGATAALDSINFTESGAKLTIKGSTNAGTIKTTNGIEFTKDNTILELTGDKDLAIDTTVNSKDAGKHGKIIWDVAGEELEFAKAIGDVTKDNSLGELHVVNGGVVLGKDAHIKKLSVAGDDVTVTLSKNAVSNYRFGSIELASGDTTTFKLGNDTVLKSNGSEQVNYGSSEKKLKLFDLSSRNLTIENNVNIYSNKFESSAPLGGGGGAAAKDLVFKGNSIFSAPVGDGVINGINVNGKAGNIVRITENIKANNDVTFGTENGSIIQFEGEAVTGAAGKTVGAAASAKTGVVRFARTGGDQTVDYAIGNKVSDVQFIGKNVKLAQNFDAKGISFTDQTKNKVEVTFKAGADLGKTGGVAADKIVTNNSSFVNTLKVDADQTFGANFQVVGSNNTVILGSGDKTFDVGSTKMNKAIIRTDTDNQGTVDMKVQNAVLYQVGEDSKSMKVLDFNQNGTVSDGTWAKNINVDRAKVATFGGVVHSEELKLGVDLAGKAGVAVGSTANFNDGATLDTKITTIADDKSIANFAGSATLNENVGVGGVRLAEINFSASGDKTVKFNNSALHATKLTFKDGKHELNGNLTLNGNATLTGSNIDLKNRTLTSTGGSVGGSSGGSLVLKDDITLGLGIDDSASGTIKVISDSELNVQDLKSIAINVTQTGNVDVFGNRELSVINASEASKITSKNVDLAAIVSAAKVQTTGSSLVKWNASLSADGKNLILRQANNVTPAVLEITRGDRGAAAILADKRNEMLVNQVAGMLGDANASEDMKVARVIETMNRIQDTNGESENQDLEGAQVVASDMVNNHLHGDLMLSADAVQVSSVDDSAGEGIAAGSCEVHDRFKSGLWLSPFYRSAEQKRRKGVSGYDSSVSGLSLGADTMVNNDLRLGAAFTYAHSDLKHQNVRKGDKSKIDSYLFSLYAMQYVTNNAFVQGIATVGANTVKGNSKRVLNITANETARSKYNSMSFSVEGMTGYNYMVQDFVLTPMGGLRFMRVNDGGYTENGTTNSNLKVSKKAAHRFDLIAGGRVTAPKFMLADMSMTPEAHGFITHDFIGKNPQSDVRLEYSSAPFPRKSKNPARTSYNLGLSLNAEQGMMQYSLGYDFHAAEKFTAHQGTFKVRVNF